MAPIDINNQSIDSVEVNGQIIDEITVDGNVVFSGEQDPIRKQDLALWYTFQNSDGQDFAVGGDYATTQRYDLFGNVSFGNNGPGNSPTMRTDSDTFKNSSVNIPGLRGDPQFTVSMWIRLEESSVNDGSWGLGGGNTGNGINSYTRAFNNDEEIGWDLWSSQRFSTNQLYDQTNFQHICWVKDGGMNSSGLFNVINGTRFNVSSEGSGSFRTPNVTTGFGLGYISANSSRNLTDFTFADVRVYDQPLTTAECQDIFSAGPITA